MNETLTDKKNPTALDLLLVAPPQQNLDSGVYIAEYESLKERRAKESGNCYFEHTLTIKNDEKYKDLHFCILSSRELKRGNKPKYNTKLYKIVTCLLKRELNSSEQIKTSELVSKRCKVFIKNDDDYFEVVEIFREDANVQLDSLGNCVVVA